MAKVDKAADSVTAEVNGADTSDVNKEGKKSIKAQASVSETLSFAFTSGTKTSVVFLIGVIGALGNGLVSGLQEKRK
jgi:hypothetical protein